MRCARPGSAAAAAAAAVLCAWPAIPLACGPFFPNRILVGNDAAIRSAPRACFAHELRRLASSEKLPFRAVPPKDGNHQRQTVEADVGDLTTALEAAGVPEDRRSALLRDYRRLCESLRPGAVRENTDRRAAEREAAPTPLEELAVPAGLPDEFADYLRGAIAWRRGEAREARAAWEKLLERPAAERRYRSTWAAFMLGKSWLGVDDAKAAGWFERVRGMPAEGFRDSLGLASASLGWQARAELNAGHRDVAIEFYLEQFATGDETAVVSLQWAVRDLLKGDAEEIGRAAALDFIRPVVTAYVISREGWHWDEKLSAQHQAWLAAVEKVAVRGMAGADRLGLLAYQLGDLESTERWLRRAPAGSPLAKWLRAKMLMREGRLDGAAVLLSQAARSFPPEENWSDVRGWGGEEDWGAPMSAARQAQGEIGFLQLARRHYTEALDALVKGDFRQDAAYVAERVLHTEELAAYVEKSCSEEPKPAATKVKEAKATEVALEAEEAAPADQAEETEEPGESARTWLRRVLAKRLAREGRLPEARRYFPEALRGTLDTYVDALGRGRDPNRPAADRAASLWAAAQLARKSGMELMGTEVEPDWAIEGGNYELEAFAAGRTKAGETEACAATPDEQERARSHAASPAKRFHYRYTAAAVAWDAAGLMPDNSTETANVLWTAGCWLKDRDPREADRFYKALVRRCRRTDLGHQADALRWFPKSP